MAKKIKAVLPSLREKKRYLVFEILSPKRISSAAEASALVWDAARGFMGECGAAAAGIMVLHDHWNPAAQRGIIRVSHRAVDALKASLTLATGREGMPLIMQSISVSGMLHKAKECSLES